MGKDKQAELHIFTARGAVALIGWEIVPKEHIQNEKQQKRQSQKKHCSYIISILLFKIRNGNYITNASRDAETLNVWVERI